jgi:hypothetical protein
MIQKIVACDHMRLYYCKPILQILYKDSNALLWKKQRIVISSSWHIVRLYCWTHLAKILQRYKHIHPKTKQYCKDVFTKKQTHMIDWCVRACATNLCSPNEDFGRMNKRGNPDFRLTFQWFVAQIEYSRPWKVLPSKIRSSSFVHPSKIFVWDGVHKSMTA